MIFLSLLNLLFVSSLNSISLPSWLPEYLTPLGPGVKEECLAASHRYLDLLNVSVDTIDPIICGFSLRMTAPYSPLLTDGCTRCRMLVPSIRGWDSWRVTNTSLVTFSPVWRSRLETR